MAQNVPELLAVDPGALASEDALLALRRAHDALVVVLPSPASRHLGGLAAALPGLAAAASVDASLERPGARAPLLLPVTGAPGGRVVLAVTTSLAEDTDDVRLVAEAASAGVSRSVEAGASRPLVAVLAPESPRFARAREVAALASLGSQWVPLEAREAERGPRTASAIGVVGLTEAEAQRVTALERGRALCRDITGTEPERMAPLRVAELCEAAFSGTGVAFSVERDVSAYPLLAAVARASSVVPRQRPCVVRLEYAPEGAVRRTVVLAGKGVTYDTGGADLKTDGAMAGMSRDKGGAGAVAGLMRAVAALAPLTLEGVRVVALLGLVRNAIGEESFVSDEIIRARSGARVRIGNTDAEGRLVLADLLAAGREIVEGAPGAVLASVATLTGHAYRAYGPYVAVIGNGAAARAGEVDRLDALGELWGEPMERSRLRREDFTLVAARSSAEDVVSSNRLPSVSTPRGHQFPFAFLNVAAGLRGSPLPLLHLDIAGAALDPPDWQFGRPTGSPVATLAAWLSEGA